MIFTDAELEYLHTQRLGRLATLAPSGGLQNSPVGFHVDVDAGVVDIGGRAMGTTRKFRNVTANKMVAFVVDDIASLNPWRVRGVEIRGVAEALTDQPPRSPYMSREIIRIHPRRIISWGLGHDGDQRSSRDVGR